MINYELTNKTTRTLKLTTFVKGTGGEDKGTVDLHPGKSTRISERWDEVEIWEVE